MNDIFPIILKYVYDSQTWRNISLSCKKFSKICKSYVHKDYKKFLHLKKILVCIIGVNHSHGKGCSFLDHRMGEECSCHAFPRHWENKFSYPTNINQTSLESDYNVFFKMSLYEYMTTINGKGSTSFICQNSYSSDFSWDQVVWPGDCKRQIIDYKLPNGISK